MDNTEKDKTKVMPVAIPDFKKLEQEKKIEEAIVTEVNDTDKKVFYVKKVDYTFRAAIFGILSIFLLLGVYFVYNYSLDFLETKEKVKEQNFVFENQLVRGDRSRVISLEAGSNRETVRGVLIQALKNDRVNKGEVSIITPSYLRDTWVGEERKLISEPQRGDDFFFTFAPRSTLNLRALSGQAYALGTVGVSDDNLNGTRNFLAFSVSSAPDAVREMLRYENQIYFDMKEVLNLPEITGGFAFKDVSDNNQLLRVGSDDNGIVLVYGFPSPKTILIAPDVQTYMSLITRLK